MSIKVGKNGKMLLNYHILQREHQGIAQTSKIWQNIISPRATGDHYKKKKEKNSASNVRMGMLD